MVNVKDVLFKIAMFLRLYDKEEGTTFYDNGYHQCIADLREGKLTVYTKSVCEVHHNEPLVCLRCIQQMPPLQIVPETPPARPCIEYFDNVKYWVNSDTETLPHLNQWQMEELLARHSEAS